MAKRKSARAAAIDTTAGSKALQYGAQVDPRLPQGMSDGHGGVSMREATRTAGAGALAFVQNASVRAEFEALKVKKG